VKTSVEQSDERRPFHALWDVGLIRWPQTFKYWNLADDQK
jgi:hypothetical protein